MSDIPTRARAPKQLVGRDPVASLQEDPAPVDLKHSALRVWVDEARHRAHPKLHVLPVAPNLRQVTLTAGDPHLRVRSQIAPEMRLLTTMSSVLSWKANGSMLVIS